MSEFLPSPQRLWRTKRRSLSGPMEHWPIRGQLVFPGLPQKLSALGSTSCAVEDKLPLVDAEGTFPCCSFLAPVHLHF